MTTDDIQARADLFAASWKERAAMRSVAASVLAAEDDARAAESALESKQAHGAFPWEMPEDAIMAEQAAWLQAAGHDVGELRRQAVSRMERLVRECEQAKSARS